MLRHPTRAGRRDAGKNTLFARHAPGHFFGVGLADQPDLVDHAGVVNPRQVFRRPFADTGNARTLGRLRANDPDTRVLLLEKTPHAGNRAGGAHGADKVGDLPAGIGPDFRPGGLKVRAWVVRIAKLVQHLSLALGLHLQRQVARRLHAARLGGENEFGPKSPHGLGAFNGQILGHHQDHAVALDRSGHGQSDTGIARGGFDQRVARRNVAALLCPRNHGQRRAVFHRTRRVVTFQLTQDDIVSGGRVIRADTLQRRQGGAANQLLQRGIGLLCGGTHAWRST